MKYKPYTLVHVREPMAGSESGEIGYVGETMSFSTPADTVMVRRAPGFPGTLIEAPAAWLLPCNWKRAFTAVAIVGGPGTFPVDMLRYDSCVPVNFTLEPSYSGFEAKLIEGLHGELLVARTAEHAYKAEQYTTERWRSFLWGIRLLKVDSVGARS